MKEYSPSEMMIVRAARELEDGQVVFVGIGLPNLAANLAKRLHAPHIEMIYEAGVFGARPLRLPLSIGDPTLVSGATAVCSIPEIFMFFILPFFIEFWTRIFLSIFPTSQVCHNWSWKANFPSKL